MYLPAKVPERLLFDASEPSGRIGKHGVQDGHPQLDKRSSPLPRRESPEDFRRTLIRWNFESRSSMSQSAFRAAVRSRAEGLFVLETVNMFRERSQIAQLALKHRLPTSFAFREYVDAGGLASYGVNFPDMGRRAAIYVDRILKGAKPADLPVEQATTFELVINLKTAKALGLTIPPSLLQRADQVIE